MLNSLLRRKNKNKDTAEEVVRSIAVGQIWQTILETFFALELYDGEYRNVIDFYYDEDDKVFFVVFVKSGQIYRADLTVTEDGVTVGEEIIIPVDRQNPDKHKTIFRQADGRYRWLSIAATSALNRSGEIDSRDLFDSFVDFIERTGKYPILNFYHCGVKSRLGIADYAARDEHVYILSGLFDDTPFGIAAARGIEADPGYWGDSIEFVPTESTMLRVVTDDTVLSIPVYTKGINTAVSILPESDAAAWGTIQITADRSKLEGTTHMNARVQAALQKLFQGDEELVEGFAGQVDDVNREVAEMVHREVENETEAVDESTEGENESTDTAESETEEVGEAETIELTAEVEVDVTPELVDIIYQQIADRVQATVTEAIAANNEQINGLFAEMRQLRDGLRELNSAVNDVAEEQAVIQEDRPVKVRKVLTVRARPESTDVVTPAAEKPTNLADTANATLKNIYGGD